MTLDQQILTQLSSADAGVFGATDRRLGSETNQLRQFQLRIWNFTTEVTISLQTHPVTLLSEGVTSLRAVSTTDNSGAMGYLTAVKVCFPDVLEDVQVTSPENTRTRVEDVKAVCGCRMGTT